MSGPLDDDTREHLAELGARKRLRRGQALFHQGDAADSVFLVVTGRLRIVITTPSGRELLIAHKGEGELVGELACLDHRGRTASAVADGPTEGIVIATDRFLEALTAHGALAVELLRSMSAQLRRADERIAARNSANAFTRLAAQLVDLCSTLGEHRDENGPIELRITQDDLAGWIGTTRESVARSLAIMRSDNVLSTGRQRIKVHDLDRLVALSIE